MTDPATSTDLLGTLGINGKLFIAQLVNFSVILFVMWRWVYRPLLRLMDAREKKIADGLTNADKAKLEVAEAGRVKEEILRGARTEARDLLEAARADAEEERKRMMAETQSDLERQLTEAKERLKREKDATLEQVRKEIGSLVLLAVEKTAPQAVEEDRGRVLVNAALSDL